MKKLLSLGGLLLALAAANFASAVPISGKVYFNSTGATVDTGNLATANAYTGFDPVFVSTGLSSPTGDYAGLGGVAVTFNTFNFGTPVVPFTLWTIISGGLKYTFEASSVTITEQNVNFLNLKGNGLAKITDLLDNDVGYDATSGTWTITNTGQGGQVFTFGATTAVPDGGTTAALMGLGLVAVGMIARRRRAIA